LKASSVKRILIDSDLLRPNIREANNWFI